MGLTVDFLQFADADVAINLRRLQAGVPTLFLDLVDVEATFSDVSVAIVQFFLRRQLGRKYDVNYACDT
jgi:hypothetical protein